MMAGENVKAFAPPFKKHCLRQRVHAIFHRGLRCLHKSFGDFIQHYLQALIFCYFFIKEKIKAFRRLAEARQCEGNKIANVLRQAQDDNLINEIFSNQARGMEI